MENVVLTIHLILAVLLTGVVLLQRSEGGGLGMGGGGGGVMTGRQAANALTRLTWIFGIALFVTSIALTIIAARQVSNSSIMDQLGVPASRQESTLPQAPAYVPPPAPQPTSASASSTAWTPSSIASGAARWAPLANTTARSGRSPFSSAAAERAELAAGAAASLVSSLAALRLLPLLEQRSGLRAVAAYRIVLGGALLWSARRR